MINALTIDVEDWYCPELLRGYLPLKRDDQIIESIEPILNILDDYGINATFMVVGSIAKKNPELVKKLHDKGHEIASHGWSHKTLHELGKRAFENEIERSVKLLVSITGERPIGFRAPSFSIDNSTKWAFEILENYKFEYDASVFPIRTMLYGISGVPLQIYRPSKEDIRKEDCEGNIIEFPMTIVTVGTNIPISGGFYLRLFPSWFLNYGIREVNKKRPAMLYVHPWEIYSKTPRLRMPLIPKFITYYGIESTLDKLKLLLNEFKFTSVKSVLDL